MDILNAYLERNLRENGGVLDGVIFAMVKYTMEERIKAAIERVMDYGGGFSFVDRLSCVATPLFCRTTAGHELFGYASPLPSQGILPRASG